jgi:hypothetical protein
MQRSRPAVALAALVPLVAALGVAGCAARTPARPAPDALLALAVEPPDATVRVDDRVIGSGRSVAGRWVAVAHGVHRVAVNAPGFDRYEEEVDLAPGRHERVVRLVPTPER